MTVEKVTQGLGQDSVSSMVQEVLRENSVVAQVFTDVSEFAEEGDTSISFPRNKNRFTVQKLSGSQKGDDQDLVIDFDKLPLDQEAHIQWVIKKFDQKKSKVRILENAIDNATEEHALQLDQDLIDELFSVSGNTPVDISGGLTQEKVVDAIVAANKARIPKRDRRWLFGNDAYGTLLKIDGFVDASKSNLDIVRTGQIGVLYNVPVFESDIMESADGVLANKNAVVYGFAAGPEVEDQKAIEYGTGSRRYVMDQNYGVKNMHEGKLYIHLEA